MKEISSPSNKWKGDVNAVKAHGRCSLGPIREKTKFWEETLGPGNEMAYCRIGLSFVLMWMKKKKRQQKLASHRRTENLRCERMK